MTNREKVIYSIGRCICHVPDACRDCAYDAGHPYNECVELLLKDALSLLKKQEAVKPCVAVDTWICPKCGHTLESQYLIDDKENPRVLVHEQYNFCPNCGMEVKWG